jgi:hypothetical protein
MEDKRGNTRTILMSLSAPLGEGMKLKVGLYTPYGKPLYETTYPDGDIIRTDETHYALKLTHGVTSRLLGRTELRAAVYTPDKETVMAAKNHIDMFWKNEPVTRELK